MGEMAGKVTREYNVSMDMHGLSVHPMGGDGWKSNSGIQCIHGYAWTVRAPHGGRWLEKLLGNTMYPWICMDCPCTPWGEMAGKVTREYNVSMDTCMDCPCTPWGEMAGKVTREYNVSMDMHGLSVHPMGGDGWKSYSGIQCIHGYAWTVRAPHGGDGWKSYSGIQCIHGYAWTVRAPHGGDR